MININRELYDYLYNEKGAEYSLDPNGVSLNVNNDNNKNLKYLGTYFPRSFTEAYKIYSNIFSNEDVFNKFNEKDKIRVLDIGSGTGGNLCGLLQVLVERFQNKEIIIISIDGNNDALNLQLDVINKLWNTIEANGNKLSGNLHHMNFNNKEEIEEKLDKLSMDNSIDIMHSFKFVNEFYKIDYELNKGMYAKLMCLGDKWLKKSGMLCLVDVTNKVSDLTFISIIFNNEVRQYFNNEESELNYLIPRCCAINYKVCNKTINCFSRLTFNVHFENIVNESKINYKLFIKNKLGKQLRNKLLDTPCGYETCYCRDYNDDFNCTKKFKTPYEIIEGSMEL